MNNRGKPLSYLELLKNRLIYLSLKFDTDDYEKTRLRSAINDCWKAIYHNLGRNKENPLDDDRFLNTHYTIYFYNDNDDYLNRNMIFPLNSRGVYARDLLERRFITKNVTSEASDDNGISISDIYKYVSSLQESVETWYKIWNPTNSDLEIDIQNLLVKINRLNLTDFYPLLLVVLQEKQQTKDKINFLNALERYMFVIHLISSRNFDLSFIMEFDQRNILKLTTEFKE